MIPLTRPTVPPVASTILTWKLFCFARFWNLGMDVRKERRTPRVKVVITNGPPCLWISLVDQYNEWSALLIFSRIKRPTCIRHRPLHFFRIAEKLREVIKHDIPLWNIVVFAECLFLCFYYFSKTTSICFKSIFPFRKRLLQWNTDKLNIVSNILGNRS